VKNQTTFSGNSEIVTKETRALRVVLVENRKTREAKVPIKAPEARYPEALARDLLNCEKLPLETRACEKAKAITKNETGGYINHEVVTSNSPNISDLLLPVLIFT